MIALLAVETGISPAELLRDPDLLEDLAEVVIERAERRSEEDLLGRLRAGLGRN